jgi:ATP-dependent DNA helicase RecQ
MSSPHEAQAVQAVLAGRDTLLVTSTGSGRSAIDQISSSLSPGITVVISPLFNEEARRDAVFLSAEQLASDEVLDDLRQAGPSLIAIDHAHCISELGEDFRPDYLRLGAFVAEMGHPTVLALTATTSRPVHDEIVERLHMHDPLVVVSDAGESAA